MRAATVIVGAIAISSCLIALALVLTSGKGTTSTSSTRPPAQEQNTKHGAAETSGRPAAASGPIQCNVEVTVEGASCFLGKNVLSAYEETGSASVTALDPESGEDVSFECNGAAPTVCTSRSGISVYLAP